MTGDMNIGLITTGIPKYIFFATNIYLTSHGLDSIYRILDEYAVRLNLRGWHLWAGDDISRYLDIMADVRYGFVLGHDYVSQVSSGSQAANFAQFELTDLGKPSAGTPEIIGAWWRLIATHETSPGCSELCTWFDSERLVERRRPRSLYPMAFKICCGPRLCLPLQVLMPAWNPFLHMLCRFWWLIMTTHAVNLSCTLRIRLMRLSQLRLS